MLPSTTPHLPMTERFEVCLLVFRSKTLKLFLDPESIRVRIETGAQRAYFKAQKCFSHPLLKNKLLIPGTNLERITMTVSIFTIVIVILQVVAEVLRVTAIDHKVQTRLLTWNLNVNFLVHCIKQKWDSLVQSRGVNFVCQWFRLLSDNALVFHSNFRRPNPRSTTRTKYRRSLCVSDCHIFRFEFYYSYRKRSDTIPKTQFLSGMDHTVWTLW